MNEDRHDSRKSLNEFEQALAKTAPAPLERSIGEVMFELGRAKGASEAKADFDANSKAVRSDSSAPSGIVASRNPFWQIATAALLLVSLGTSYGWIQERSQSFASGETGHLAEREAAVEEDFPAESIVIVPDPAVQVTTVEQTPLRKIEPNKFNLASGSKGYPSVIRQCRQLLAEQSLGGPSRVTLDGSDLTYSPFIEQSRRGWIDEELKEAL